MNNNSSSSKRAGLRNTLIAVVVIVIVGVGTFYGVGYISSTQPTSNSSSSVTSSSGLSTSTVSTSSASSGQTGSTSSGSSQSQTQSSQSTAQSSRSTITSYEFSLTGTPTVNVTGSGAVLSASYSNNGTTSVSANFYLALFFPNGTSYTSGILFGSNGPTVAPGGSFPVSVQMGPLPVTGTYSVAFYALNSVSKVQISEQVTLMFTIAS